MATIYVDDTASGAADGTSWTDAYTTMNAALLAASNGDLILIDDGHDETDADMYENRDIEVHLRFRSVDKADDSYSPRR